MSSTIFTGGARNYGPRLSRDGSKVVWFREGPLTSSAREIWIANADGSGAQQLTSNGYPDNVPDISPDNGSIVWASVPGGSDIWIMDADGTGARALTTTGTALLPRFSPDGSRVAFYSTCSGSMSVFLVNVDGSEEMELTATRGLPTDQLIAAEVGPSWSPDGRFLAFNGRVDSGPSGVYLVDLWSPSIVVRIRNNAVDEAIYDWR